MTETKVDRSRNSFGPISMQKRKKKFDKNSSIQYWMYLCRNKYAHYNNNGQSILGQKQQYESQITVIIKLIQCQCAADSYGNLANKCVTGNDK